MDLFETADRVRPAHGLGTGNWDIGIVGIATYTIGKKRSLDFNAGYYAIYPTSPARTSTMIADLLVRQSDSR